MIPYTEWCRHKNHVGVVRSRVPSFLLLWMVVVRLVRVGDAFSATSWISRPLLPLARQQQQQKPAVYRSRSKILSYGRSWNDDLDDDDDSDDDSVSDEESDWMQAELTLRAAPNQPHPDLSAETVALTCCRSLQWVDYPTPLAGLATCFDFFTYECRKAVTARQGGNTIERFQEYGVLSPALQPFMGAHRVDLGEGTFTAAKPPLRGAMVSFPVSIHVAMVRSVQYPSGMERGGIATEPPVVHMVMRLEQQRRPPNQGCWLIREVLDVRHAFAGDMGNAHVGG